MVNRVVLVGRMTRDPELRKTAGGASVTNFTLALNRNFNSQDGQTADYINCVVWNKIAENVAKYCSKGSLVGVDGKLRSRTYDDNSGRKVYVVEVLCDSVQFLDTRNSRNNQEQQKQNVFEQNKDNFYDNTNNNIDLESDFDNSMDTFDIMDDDIQF